MQILNCGGKILNLSKPKIMGILNLTPDSFFDGNKYNSIDKAILHVDYMIQEGLDILDVGAASTKPGASQLTADEELKRLMPSLKEIRTAFPDLIISIDTYWRKVAEKTIEMGAAIINDVSAGSIDPGLLDFVKEAKIPYILMHMKGTPTTMQDDPKYKNIISEIMAFFFEKLRVLDKKGIEDVIIDPGFGFGKTIDHNYELLRNLNVFKILDKEILVGISRKSMIYKPLEIDAEDSLPATTALHLQALNNGAKILRVHDVKEAKQVVQLFERLKIN